MGGLQLVLFRDRRSALRSLIGRLTRCFGGFINWIAELNKISIASALGCRPPKLLVQKLDRFVSEAVQNFKLYLDFRNKRENKIFYSQLVFPGTNHRLYSENTLGRSNLAGGSFQRRTIDIGKKCPVSVLALSVIGTNT